MDLSRVNKNYYKIYMRVVSELIWADKELTEYGINSINELLNHFQIRIPNNQSIEDFLSSEYLSSQEKVEVVSLCKDMPKDDVEVLVDILDEITSLNENGQDIRELEIIDKIKDDLKTFKYSNKPFQVLFGLIVFVFFSICIIGL